MRVCRQKGYVLIYVVLICTALMIMGSFLLDLHNTDLKIAVNLRDSLRTYYLAAAGIEIGLGVLLKHDPFYCGNNDISFAGENINISVEALEQENGGRQVKIISLCKTGIIEEQVSVQFQSFPENAGGLDGSILGWYDEESGEIIRGIHNAEGIVIVGSSNVSPLLLRSSNEAGNSTVFSAEQVFFTSQPVSLVVEEELDIIAEAAVFMGSVLVCAPQGSLHFLHPSGGPVRVYLREEVSTFAGLVLKPGVYSFPDGFRITTDSSLQETLCHRVLPVVPGTITYSRGKPI